MTKTDRSAAPANQFFEASIHQKYADVRDHHDRLTSAEIAEGYAHDLLQIATYESDLPPNVKDEDELRFWLGQGRQLSLAAGNAGGELRFAKFLGIDPNRVTCVDRNVPADMKSLEEVGVDYRHLDLVRWAAEDVLEREKDRSLPRFRVTTIFGAEYAMELSDPNAKAAVAAAIYSSLEPGGFIMIQPGIKEMDDSLQRAGLKRLGDISQIYQKPLKN